MPKRRVCGAGVPGCSLPGASASVPCGPLLLALRRHAEPPERAANTPTTRIEPNMRTQLKGIQLAKAASGAVGGDGCRSGEY
jgi:hypothetical protein